MILEGGGACALHALDVFDARGRRHPLVLKRFFREDWLAREPDVAAREARILEALGPTSLPTPQLVGVDPDGSGCDHPAVLMTRLPGRVELAPPDLEAWLRGIAELLPRIHELPAAFRDLVQPFRVYQQLDALEVPTWSREPDAWQRIVDFAQAPLPAADDCFVHRDYHPTNILWLQGRVSGVLDWTNASHGPAGVDAGHCRLNLVQLFGVDVAERFLAIVLEIVGRRELPNPAWDIVSLVEMLPKPSVYWGWVNLGVTGLTVERVCERLDAYAALLASRI